MIIYHWIITAGGVSQGTSKPYGCVVLYVPQCKVTEPSFNPLGEAKRLGASPIFKLPKQSKYPISKEFSSLFL